MEKHDIEATNEISRFLAKIMTGHFNRGIALRIKPSGFSSRRSPANWPCDDFNNRLATQCVVGDVVHYLIEDAYREKPKKSLFFETLVAVSEKRPIPCGWNG